jgi:N-formylmaleamate deformylase
MNTMKKFLLFIGIVVAAASLHAQSYSFRADVSGKGKPIILIPGLGCDGAVWNETVAVLSANYECHVLTLPGFSTQPAIETDAFLETVRAELVRYIRENKLKKVVIIGHSLGGFLAMRMAITEPELASKLIIVDSLPFFAANQDATMTVEKARPMADMMKANIANQTKEQFEVFQPMILRNMITAEEHVQVALEWSRNSQGSTVAQAMYELYTTDLRDEVAKIKQPTLVLGAWAGYKDYGGTKEATQAIFDGQFAKLPGYKLVLSETAKHFIMWDDPDLFMAQVKMFLGEKL